MIWYHIANIGYDAIYRTDCGRGAGGAPLLAAGQGKPLQPISYYDTTHLMNTIKYKYLHYKI